MQHDRVGYLIAPQVFLCGGVCQPLHHGQRNKPGNRSGLLLRKSLIRLATRDRYYRLALSLYDSLLRDLGSSGT